MPVALDDSQLETLCTAYPLHTHLSTPTLPLGTGGMLPNAEDPPFQTPSLSKYGQELNRESYAICKAAML